MRQFVEQKGVLGPQGAFLSAAEMLKCYSTMVVARAVEAAVNKLFLEGQVTGTTHLAAGQEAVAVGASSALSPDDYVLATYRGHHHAIARGVTPLQCLGEILGRELGTCRGRGGSMHITLVEKSFLGCYAIVGAHLPLACGAALTCQMQRGGRVTVVFFGDGATNIGAFHEAVNLAAVWHLPVIFVCENNLYAEYTPIGAVTPVEHPAADRALAYNVPSVVVDGNDLEAVRAAVSEARRRAVEGGGPTMIEAVTYRHYGHSRSDPAKYRPDTEVAQWMERDPLKLTRERLRTMGVTEGELEETERSAQHEVDVAVEEALRAAPPADEGLFEDLWADGSSGWRN